MLSASITKRTNGERETELNYYKTWPNKLVVDSDCKLDCNANEWVRLFAACGWSDAVASSTLNRAPTAAVPFAGKSLWLFHDSTLAGTASLSRTGRQPQRDECCPG